MKKTNKKTGQIKQLKCFKCKKFPAVILDNKLLACAKHAALETTKKK